MSQMANLILVNWHNKANCKDKVSPFKAMDVGDHTNLWWDSPTIQSTPVVHLQGLYMLACSQHMQASIDMQAQL